MREDNVFPYKIMFVFGTINYCFAGVDKIFIPIYI